MKYLYYKQNRSQKADLVKSIFNTIGTCFLLVIINKAVSPHHFWARIPIMIMMATVIFKVIKFLGHKVAESIDVNSESRPRIKEDVVEINNDFDFSDFIQKPKEPQKLWKDSELVKSNLS